MFRNRWTARMVRRLDEMGIRVREGLGRWCQPVKQVKRSEMSQYWQYALVNTGKSEAIFMVAKRKLYTG